MHPSSNLQEKKQRPKARLSIVAAMSLEEILELLPADLHPELILLAAVSAQAVKELVPGRVGGGQEAGAWADHGRRRSAERSSRKNGKGNKQCFRPCPYRGSFVPENEESLPVIVKSKEPLEEVDAWSDSPSGICG